MTKKYFLNKTVVNEYETLHSKLLQNVHSLISFSVQPKNNLYQSCSLKIAFIFCNGNFSF